MVGFIFVSVMDSMNQFRCELDASGNVNVNLDRALGFGLWVLSLNFGFWVYRVLAVSVLSCLIGGVGVELKVGGGEAEGLRVELGMELAHRNRNAKFQWIQFWMQAEEWLRSLYGVVCGATGFRMEGATCAILKVFWCEHRTSSAWACKKLPLSLDYSF